VQVVLGVDPGVVATGYGVVESDGTSLRVLEAGVVKTRSSDPLPQRLSEIHRALKEVLEKFSPQVMAMEGLYSAYDHPKTAILMGHARGVVCLAAGQSGVPVVDYAPARVKKSVIGAGRASKGQVGRMVALRLSLPEEPKPSHVADALAVALCHIDTAARPALLGGGA